jgi:hypothetical protein
MAHNIISYLVLFLITNLVFSYITSLFLLKIDKTKLFSIVEILLLSFSVTPAMVSLTIYYLYLLFPKMTPLFYFAATILVFISIWYLSRKQSLRFKNLVTEKVHSAKNENPTILKVFCSLLVIFVFFWQIVVIKIPLLRHDTLEYATWAKVTFERKSIEYSKYKYDQTSGFYYVGLHGFTFPILLVWELTWNSIVHSSNDYYFRSITGWYWIIILSTFYYYLSKKSKLVALIGTISLAITPAYAAAFFYYHLDTLRMSLLLLSLPLLIYSIEKKELTPVLVLGAVSGLMANVHSLGAIFSGLYLFLYFAFSKENYSGRFKKILLLIFLILFFGGIHYVLDLFLGTGWLLKEFKFPFTL